MYSFWRLHLCLQSNMTSFESFVFCCFLATFFSSSAAIITPSESFTASTDLQANEGYRVYWKWDSEYITFEIHVKTLGWVGFGFSSSGGMTNADVVTAWVKSGTATLQDRWATTTALPALDSSQDYTLRSASETATHTIVKFTRPLQSCDDKDFDLSEGTIRIIWAYGSADPAGSDPTYHGATNRGSKSIQLLTAQPTHPSLPSDAYTLDLLIDNFTIPHSQDTTYQCKLIKLPEKTGKVHVVKVEHLVMPGSEDHVHHIVVYGCQLSQNTMLENNADTDYPCYTANPGVTSNCQQVMFSWAIGGGDFYFPENAGHPLGDTDSPAFVRMELHYDNPQLKQNETDSSGIRLTLTNTTRTHDVGMLEIGAIVSPQQLVPPHASTFYSRHICTSECFTEAMGSDPGSAGVKAFAVMLHAHLLGRHIHVRHLRNGQEIGVFAEDSGYDFNFQEFRILANEESILPTDDLIMDCIYDSTNRTAMTSGGLGTSNEMCMGFIYYYPKFNLSRCQSVSTYEQIQTFLPDASWPATVWDSLTLLNAQDWTIASVVAAFQNTTIYGNHTQQCRVHGTSTYSVDQTDLVLPVLNLEPDTDDTCTVPFTVSESSTSSPSSPSRGCACLSLPFLVLLAAGLALNL